MKYTKFVLIESYHDLLIVDGNLLCHCFTCTDCCVAEVCNSVSSAKPGFPYLNPLNDVNIFSFPVPMVTGIIVL